MTCWLCITGSLLLFSPHDYGYSWFKTLAITKAVATVMATIGYNCWNKQTSRSHRLDQPFSSTYSQSPWKMDLEIGWTIQIGGGYESLIAKLRLIFFKPRFLSEILILRFALYTLGKHFTYCVTVFCSLHQLGFKTNMESQYKRNFLQLWNAIASEEDSEIVFAPNKNIALCMSVWGVYFQIMTILEGL